MDLIKIQKNQIIDQKRTCICLVSKNGEEETETGFIFKMPYPEKDDNFKILIVSNGFLSSSDKNKNIQIKISINNGMDCFSINLDESEIFESHKYGITFIDIKYIDENKQIYLELDDNINLEQSYYRDKSNYILNNEDNNKIFFSGGADFSKNINHMVYFKNKKIPYFLYYCWII